MACRICTANDREALVEDLAKALWENEPGKTFDPRWWDDAGDHWQRVYRSCADRSLAVIEAGR